MGTSQKRGSAAAVAFGGVLSIALFVPFTIAHGPTSVDLERDVLGWDMHAWGFLMGTLPPLLIGVGLRQLRERVAGGRQAAYRSLTVMCFAMFLFAAMNLAFRAIGPPLDLFLLAPASVVAALTTSRRGRVRAVLGLLAAAYVVALALSLVPAEFYDLYDGYRVFGIVAYGGVGLLWATLGTLLLHDEREGQWVSAG
ncbi:MAG: hypothetical protein LH477_12425 [Nocardioides sp.]|nr:hypothetical protein [Nocardioides sp.]